MKKICIDPGHYGATYNAGVIKGFYESEMAWKLSQYQKQYLEALGFEVIITRTKNEDVDLQTRGKKSKGCCLFISNHSNASGTESTDYALAIHLVDKAGTDADDVSKQLAKKLAKVIQNTMGVGSNQYWSKASEYDRDGNGKKDDNYYGVLQGAMSVGTPGLILEHSFHTNKKACTWLSDNANLKKLAKAEAEAIAEYFGASTKLPTDSAPSKQSTANKSNTKDFKVYVPITNLHIRAEASASSKSNGFTGKGTFTIVDTKTVNGVEWGKLKSGAGWICLNYARKL